MTKSMINYRFPLQGKISKIRRKAYFRDFKIVLRKKLNSQYYNRKSKIRIMFLRDRTVLFDIKFSKQSRHT